MTNPFPGMNPYLEGELWSDFHNRLANYISKKIIPLIRPKYHALIEPYIVKTDISTMGLNIYYPDVAVMENKVKEPMPIYGNRPQITAANLSVPIQSTIEVKVPVIEIRESKNKKLITVIEILSPANKRGLGFQQYQEKRKNLIAGKINLLEIDLIRGGKKVVSHPQADNCDYLCALSRKEANKTDLWTINLPSTLPTLPIPLESNDPDVAIDLQAVLNEIYQEVYYGDAIDYSEKVPPPQLSIEKTNWVNSIIKKP